MIFPSLSVFYNIMFYLFCLGLVSIITLSIGDHIYFKQKIKCKGTTDDIDTEDEISKFVFFINFFKIKGIIYFIAFSSIIIFFFNFTPIPIALSIIVGIIFGILAGIWIELVNKNAQLTHSNQTAIVLNEITEKEMGKVLLNDGTEINAQTSRKKLKKGKIVKIIKRQENFVIVE